MRRPDDPGVGAAGAAANYEYDVSPSRDVGGQEPRARQDQERLDPERAGPEVATQPLTKQSPTIVQFFVKIQKTLSQNRFISPIYKQLACCN